MAYGDTHKLEHRPMYPEYPFRKPMQRNLYYLENGKLYDVKGTLVLRADDAGDLAAYMRDNRGCIYVPSLVGTTFTYKYLSDFIRMENAKVLSSKKGKPNSIRIRFGNTSRWVSSLENWDEIPEVECLDRLWDIYEHFDVGYAPTKSSLGNKYSIYLYTAGKLGKHTAPSLACENFIHQHSVGQGVCTPGLGRYDLLRYMDIHAAFLRYYRIHPDGTAVRFLSEPEDLATYFARCTVTIHETLPLGPFPQKAIRNHKPKVFYPTEPGTYEEIYMSKEQVADCREAGCTVQVFEGFGWKSFTTDNIVFSDGMWYKRTLASGHVKDKSKSVGVAAIGRNAQERVHYFLVDAGRSLPNERVVLDKNGDPLTYCVRSEVDDRSAYMIHWWWYTVTECNRAVYHFALPYAKEGRLVMIDYDSVMVRDGDDKHQYIRKESVEEIFARAGDWKWQLLHNVNVIADRTFESDEMTRKPGVRKSA